MLRDTGISQCLCQMVLVLSWVCMLFLCSSTHCLLFIYLFIHLFGCVGSSARWICLYPISLDTAAHGLSSGSTGASFLQSMWDLSSQPRDWTCVLCVATQILKHWTTREVPQLSSVVFLCFFFFFTLPSWWNLPDHADSTYLFLRWIFTLLVHIQLSSVTRVCPTLCDLKDCRTPGFQVHHQLLELMQTHVHWASDVI